MVVADDGHGLDAGADQEVDQHRLQLGLAGLEVVPGNVHLLLVGQLDHARHEGVLGRAVDVGGALEDGRGGEQRGRGHLGGVVLDAVQQVLGRVVEPLPDVAEALGVGRPQHDHLVHPARLTEVSDVLPQLDEQLLLGGLSQDVVRAVSLVGCDELGQVHGRAGLHRLHVGHELLLDVVVEDSGTRHRIGHVQRRDVPPCKYMWNKSANYTDEMSHPANTCVISQLIIQTRYPTLQIHTCVISQLIIQMRYPTLQIHV